MSRLDLGLRVMMSFVDWFTGGSQRYMTLYHCMAHDWPWVTITVLLDLTVAAGYIVIARHWGANQSVLPASPAKTALGHMRNIFVLCGLCGYLFIPIKMVWPAWRLYDIFLVMLAIYTWRYAWGARQLRVIYSQLERADQLERDLEDSRAESRRKTDVFNAIGHDLRTPLNAIMLQAELAELGLDDPAATAEDQQARREALATIRASARAAAELLDRLLECGRLPHGDGAGRGPDRVDLHPFLVHLTAPFLAPAARKPLALTVDCPRDLAVEADRFALGRVVTSLVDNALKFTEEGRVEVVAERAGDEIRIHVIDTGRGIAPEHLGRLFEEFYQIQNRERDRAKGFGLGLAIARRMAEDLGGRIDVDSQPGRGSRFTLRLLGARARDERPRLEPATAHC